MKKIILSLLMLCGVSGVWALDITNDGYYGVGSLAELKEAVKKDFSGSTSTAKIRLMDDIYLKDEGELCSTFKGVLDGNGHTIYAGDANAHHDSRGFAHGKYLFVYSDGATFKNLTFKDFRADTNEHSNWSILTSQAKNGCVFKNITFDHVSVYSNKDNVGAVAGIADDCTFENITVKNSDFTVDGRWVGGVVGTSSHSKYTNCVVDDKTNICADGKWLEGALAGGIVGESNNDTFSRCVNSALITADSSIAGGIVARIHHWTTIEDCLNTGMIVSIDQSNVGKVYDRYKADNLPYKTVTYNGQEYKVKTMSSDLNNLTSSWDDEYGGIVGNAENSVIRRCANFGSIQTPETHNGGIAGNVDGCYIEYCLNDFTAPSKVCGLVGMDSFYSNQIKSCLDMSDHTFLEGTTGDIANVTNCYTLQSGHSGDVLQSVTEAQLPTGEVCAMLGEGWQQNFGVNPFPVPGHRGFYNARTLNNEYGTVCLPFPLKSDANMRYYTFSGVTDKNGNTELSFNYVDELPAGHPALYRFFRTGDYEFCSSEYNFVTSPQYVYESDDKRWSMSGTFSGATFESTTAEHIYYVSGGAIKHAKKVTIAPYRAYLYGPTPSELRDSDTGVKAVTFALEDEDGETTAISLVYDGEELVPAEHSKAYSIMGTEVSDSYRGIVIKNGKKMLRK